ncbi:hypothetical protein BT96DRAFT_990224 [Gymnopus androsaceus JB14]|uniref:Uncharacterized protein n=1 Tax=Gymnopus androsaceus JB14 TaxID=1447944 RepID=A0A6A4HZE7_9AGAR|nr:hypothetical protein BT96DRAFT_990224 [Gymnopus androsaceus JB14]
MTIPGTDMDTEPMDGTMKSCFTFLCRQINTSSDLAFLTSGFGLRGAVVMQCCRKPLAPAYVGPGGDLGLASESCLKVISKYTFTMKKRTRNAVYIDAALGPGGVERRLKDLAHSSALKREFSISDPSLESDSQSKWSPASSLSCFSIDAYSDFDYKFKEDIIRFKRTCSLTFVSKSGLRAQVQDALLLPGPGLGRRQRLTSFVMRKSNGYANMAGADTAVDRLAPLELSLSSSTITVRPDTDASESDPSITGESESKSSSTIGSSSCSIFSVPDDSDSESDIDIDMDLIAVAAGFDFPGAWHGASSSLIPPLSPLSSKLHLQLDSGSGNSDKEGETYVYAYARADEFESVSFA